MRNISFECSYWSVIVTRWDDSELYIIQEAIEDFQNLWNTILIDWGQHTNKIELLDAEDIIDKFQIIWPGKDGMIITGIVNQDIILMVPLADCGWIGFKHNSWISLWLIHAWYKWVYSDIIWNFIEQIEKIDSLENFSFFMAPMIWKKYEFWKEDYELNFKAILVQYNLKAESYFQEINKTHGYLNLKKLILDILKRHGVDTSQIYVSKPETNNPKNNYASHRLHTLAKRIEKQIKDKYWEDIVLKWKSDANNIISELDLTDREKEILTSWKYTDYLFGRRNLFIVKTWEPIVPKTKK